MDSHQVEVSQAQGGCDMFPYGFSSQFVVTAAALGISFSSSVSAIDVSVPLNPPSAAATVSPSLISFSIEQDRWTLWAGNGSRNQFFYNVLSNLKDLSGESPWLRIGADSEDHTNFDYNTQYEVDVFPATSEVYPYPEASNITVGQSFYDVIQWIPTGTNVWWGVNFGQYNLTAAYLESMAIMRTFASEAVTSRDITLQYIEVGNEADLYRTNGARSSSYNITEYVSQWIDFASNVSTANGLYNRVTPKLIGGAFADSSHTTTGFSPQGIFANGILNSAPGSLIRTISQHHYSGSFCSGSGGLLANLMSKPTIRGNVSEFESDIQATLAQGLEYVFGETNSYSCHGAPGVSNAAGAALWALDYSLFSSQVGISRLFFHEGVGYKYNFIQPVTLYQSIINGTELSTPLAPHVQPAYYAAVIAAEAIGSSGSTQATELTINNDNLAGYAFYEAGALKRAVLINSEAFLSGETNRSSIHVAFNFTGTGSSPASMNIKRLNITYADDTSGLTWGGQTYETSDGLVGGTLQTEIADVSEGVTVQETEVVLLTFS